MSWYAKRKGLVSATGDPTRITAVLDACVIYPADVRDLLMWLAWRGLFRPRWTDAIHDEWIRAVIENRPDLSRERLERTRQLMDTAVPDASVHGYQGLIQGLDLPDPDDRHVLAAAIHCRAERIITVNLKDFPAEVLSTHGIEPQHPDGFVAELMDANEEAVIAAARRHRKSLREPPKTAAQYLTDSARSSARLRCGWPVERRISESREVIEDHSEDEHGPSFLVWGSPKPDDL